MIRCTLFLCLTLCSFGAALTVAPEVEVLRKLTAKLEGKGDYNERSARRVGNRTVEFEGFISSEGDVQLAKKILAEPGQFSRWIMPGINRRPSGGDYFVKILGIDLAPLSTNVILTRLGFELPLFKQEIHCYVTSKLTTRGKALVFSATVDAKATGTYIENFEAELQFFPKDGGRMWIYAVGQVKFKNWLIYEALPDRVLTRETGDRLQIVLDNYLNEENRLRLKHKVTTAKRDRPEIREDKGGSRRGIRPKN